MKPQELIETLRAGALAVPVVHPCPCCACNPAGVPSLFASLAEEAHAHARWDAFGCPNSKYRDVFPEHGVQLLIRYFTRSRFSRSGAWNAIVDIDGGQYWRKSHTAGTWCWYAVLS